jgi:hypothetical protein
MNAVRKQRVIISVLAYHAETTIVEGVAGQTPDSKGAVAA